MNTGNLPPGDSSERRDNSMSSFEDDIENWRAAADIFEAVSKHINTALAAEDNDNVNFGLHTNDYGDKYPITYSVLVKCNQHYYLLQAKKIDIELTSATIDMNNWQMIIENMSHDKSPDIGKPLVDNRAIVQLNYSQNIGLVIQDSILAKDSYLQRDSTKLHAIADAIREGTVLTELERLVYQHEHAQQTIFGTGFLQEE